MDKIIFCIGVLFLFVRCSSSSDVQPLSDLSDYQNDTRMEYALVNTTPEDAEHLKNMVDEFITKNGYKEKEKRFQSLRLIFIRDTKFSRLFMEKDEDYPTPDLEDVLCIVTWYNTPKFIDTLIYRF